MGRLGRESTPMLRCSTRLALLREEGAPDAQLLAGEAASLVRYLLVEALEHGHLERDCERHVVLHRVQGPQHQVEDTDGCAQLLGQLLDDYRKAAARTGTLWAVW